MPPPPAPKNQGGRFKPANGQAHSHAEPRAQASTSQIVKAQNPAPQRYPRNSDGMGPPQTPQRPFSRVQTPSRASTQNGSFNTTGRESMVRPRISLQSNRFVPSSSHARMLSGPTSASTSSAKVPANNFSTSKSSDGQRMPFMVGNSNGFG
ncbi:hypothetical protein HYDPIDRAFT_105861 [Hydnomerulius pinastri MD-312]|nr:hypothetical protein HYDPIDRAFT_105861 [Hydnomerulius pinastri MD-312]